MLVTKLVALWCWSMFSRADERRLFEFSLSSSSPARSAPRRFLLNVSPVLPITVFLVSMLQSSARGVNIQVSLHTAPFGTRRPEDQDRELEPLFEHVVFSLF